MPTPSIMKRLDKKGAIRPKNDLLLQLVEAMSQMVSKEPPQPVVNVAAPSVSVEAPEVNVERSPLKGCRLKVHRDNNGLIDYMDVMPIEDAQQ